MENLLIDAKNDEDALELVRSKRNAIKYKTIQALYNIKDSWYIRRMISPSSQYQYAYVLLDTNNAAPELSDSTKFGWKVINFISSKTGSTSVTSNIRDLVGMRIFPVTMKLVSPVGEQGKTYVNKVTNINNNFTILIHEFQAQSFVGRDGRKFHFALFPALMNPVYPNDTILYGPPITPADPYFEFTTSGKCNGWFWFRTPITSFDTMTISIGNPFDLVKPNTNNTRTLIPLQLIYMAEKNEQ